jgi:hypothetical protein
MTATAFALMLAGCAASDGQSHGILEQAPIDSADMHGDYQQIAGCAYSKFVDGTANVMQRNEFPEIKQTRCPATPASAITARPLHRLRGARDTARRIFSRQR